MIYYIFAHRRCKTGNTHSSCICTEYTHTLSYFTHSHFDASLTSLFTAFLHHRVSAPLPFPPSSSAHCCSSQSFAISTHPASHNQQIPAATIKEFLGAKGELRNTTGQVIYHLGYACFWVKTYPLMSDSLVVRKRFTVFSAFMFTLIFLFLLHMIRYVILSLVWNYSHMIRRSFCMTVSSVLWNNTQIQYSTREEWDFSSRCQNSQPFHEGLFASEASDVSDV